MFLPAVLWGLLGQGLQVRPADGPGPSSGAGDHDSALSGTTLLLSFCLQGAQAQFGPAWV